VKSNCVKTRNAAVQAALVFAALLSFLGSGQAQNSQIEQQPSAAKQHAAPDLPTIFVVGDSTANNNANGARGWGDPFIDYFDAEKINVLNRARGGRSSRTFMTEGLWDKVLSEMKRGDFVLIQFGHNDAGAINDTTRARGSLPGLGEETQEIDNLLTKKHEVVHTYGWYMRQMIADTKAKGATPIVLSPIPRNLWKDGKVARADNDYGKWAGEVARAEGVPFIDVNEMVAGKYEQAGQEKVAADYFTAVDHTHTTPAGAKVNAESVVEGIRGLADCRLKDLLK